MKNSSKLWIILPLALILLGVACSDTENPTATIPEFGQVDSLITPLTQADCGWWLGLGQPGRNNKIVVEALYSVDQQIWDQNDRLTPNNWAWYLEGSHNCHVPGDWNYCGRGNGMGGQCKWFVQELLRRASGGAVTLPGNNVYDYRPWFPYRNRNDGINSAQPGEVMQWTGGPHHTAVVVTNFHDGRFEVIDSNVIGTERIGKHVISVTSGYWSGGDLKFYVINRCL